MNLAYWDALADRFDDEVLSIADSEINGKLRSAIRRASRTGSCVGDFGCGTGALLPTLSENFSNVLAIDFSSDLLRLAEERHGTRSNIQFVRHNLSGTRPFPKFVDVGVCANVLIDPRTHIRERILRNMLPSIREGGLLLLVVPAFESLLHTYRTLVRCNVRIGVRRATAVREATDLYESEVQSVVEGIVTLGTAPTKTYMYDEARHLLEDSGLEIVRVDRVEYPWDEMIENAPSELGSPYPWDWLLTARMPE